MDGQLLPQCTQTRRRRYTRSRCCYTLQSEVMNWEFIRALYYNASRSLCDDLSTSLGFISH